MRSCICCLCLAALPALLLLGGTAPGEAVGVTPEVAAQVRGGDDECYSTPKPLKACPNVGSGCVGQYCPNVDGQRVCQSPEDMRTNTIQCYSDAPMCGAANPNDDDGRILCNEITVHCKYHEPCPANGCIRVGYPTWHCDKSGSTALDPHETHTAAGLRCNAS